MADAINGKESPIEASLELSTKCSPKDVGKYLKVMYGDWEAIPSEEQRQTHNFSFKFLDNSKR